MVLRWFLKLLLLNPMSHIPQEQWLQKRTSAAIGSRWDKSRIPRAWQKDESGPAQTELLSLNQQMLGQTQRNKGINPRNAEQLRALEKKRRESPLPQTTAVLTFRAAQTTWNYSILKLVSCACILSFWPAIWWWRGINNVSGEKRVKWK